MLRACCISLPGGGFAAFPAASRPARRPSVIPRFPRRCSHPPKDSPRQQPCRVTAVLALLPSSSDPSASDPSSSCADHRGDRSLPAGVPRRARPAVRRVWRTTFAVGTSEVATAEAAVDRAGPGPLAEILPSHFLTRVTLRPGGSCAFPVPRGGSRLEAALRRARALVPDRALHPGPSAFDALPRKGVRYRTKSIPKDGLGGTLFPWPDAPVSPRAPPHIMASVRGFSVHSEECPKSRSLPKCDLRMGAGAVDRPETAQTGV
jgi:hypothetical protein